jgi:hypothetical protein
MGNGHTLPSRTMIPPTPEHLETHSSTRMAPRMKRDESTVLVFDALLTDRRDLRLYEYWRQNRVADFIARNIKLPPKTLFPVGSVILTLVVVGAFSLRNADVWQWLGQTKLSCF